MVFHKLVLADGTEIKSNKIMKTTYVTASADGQDVSPGAICTAELEMTLWGEPGSEQVKNGNLFQFYTVTNTGVETLKATLRSEKPTRTSANTYKIIAYDNVTMLDKDLTDWITSILEHFPMTLNDFAQSVCNACGVTLHNDSIKNGDYIVQELGIKSATGRQLLQWVAQISGQFVRASPNGDIEFTWYKTNSEIVINSGRSDENTESEKIAFYSGTLSYEDFVVTPVEKVQIQQNDSEVSVVYPSNMMGGNPFILNGNALLVNDTADNLTRVAQSIYNVMAEVTYTPMNVDIPYCEKIKVGDILTITDANGVTIVSYITGCIANGNSMSLESVGNYNRASTSVVNAQSYPNLIANVTNANVLIRELKADNVTVKEKLTANEADIDDLRVNKLDTATADITYATIESLDAVSANIGSLDADYAAFKQATADDFTAVNASIGDLEANKLSTKDAELQYANIDFSNIGKAAMEYFYANSGLIKDVVVGDETITGELIGVTIKGDLIEGNTIVADKLVILGDDGLYYKLNTNGVSIETEQTEYNSINGSIITAKSITATKISVEDLVAFGATIGGFKITDSAIYSGVKESATNTTRGIYLDKEGQMALGDASNFLRYYKDQNGKYRLEVSLDSLRISSSDKSVETMMEDAQDAVDKVNDLEERANSGEFAGEDATTLRIESSRGTVFKNDSVATVLSVVIYRGSNRITDSTALKSVFGTNAYLQWKWQRLDDDAFGIISSSDTRFGNNGFTFTLSPEDVDTKVTFMCELIT